MMFPELSIVTLAAPVSVPSLIINDKVCIGLYPAGNVAIVFLPIFSCLIDKFNITFVPIF